MKHIIKDLKITTKEGLSIKNYNTCTIFHLVLLKYPTMNNIFCYLSTFLVT